MNDTTNEIIIIAAIAKNNIIGSNGDIPWRIPEDFKRFKALTLGNPCIMGSKTYESLPIKPLPGRENIILTRKKDYHPDNTTVFNSLEDALNYCKTSEKTYICGGSKIYELFLPFATKLELTIVNQTPKGDTTFPKVNYSDWKLSNSEKHDGYSFNTYTKKTS